MAALQTTAAELHAEVVIEKRQTRRGDVRMLVRQSAGECDTPISAIPIQPLRFLAPSPGGTTSSHTAASAGPRPANIPVTNRAYRNPQTATQNHGHPYPIRSMR